MLSLFTSSWFKATADTHYMIQVLGHAHQFSVSKPAAGCQFLHLLNHPFCHFCVWLNPAVFVNHNYPQWSLI